MIAGLGLWLLLRDRHLIGSARRLWGEVLVGFGGWHVVDALFSHWLLGIHRVRMDAAQPLAWDVAWLIAFGLLPLALGWWLGRGAGPEGGQRVAAAGLAAAVLVAAPLAALPPTGSNAVVVLFDPDAGPDAMFRAAAAADGRAVWSDAAGSVAAIALDPAADTASLYRQGALLVSRSLGGVGCMAWLRG